MYVNPENMKWYTDEYEPDFDWSNWRDVDQLLSAILDAIKRITIGKFIDYMEENGYEQAFSTLVRYEDDTIVAACAMGQALLNIQRHEDINVAIDFLEIAICRPLRHFIVTKNDKEHMGIPQIAEQARQHFALALDDPAFTNHF